MKAIVLVTGASGTLGRHLCSLLSSRGHTVIAAGHRSRLDGLPLTVERVNLELTNPHSVEAVILKAAPDVIIHTAAMTSVAECQDEPERATDINVGGTENLLRAAESLGCPPHLIHISTDLVFDGTKGSPYTEADPLSPCQVYGTTKAAAEAAVSSPCYSGLVTILRSALILAPPNPTRPGIMDWTLDSIRQARGVFFTDEYRTPVFIDDLGRVIDRVLTHSIGGLFHIGGRERLSRAALAREVARAFRLPEDRVRTASRVEAGDTVVRLRPPDVSLDSTRAKVLLDHDPDFWSNILNRIARTLTT